MKGITCSKCHGLDFHSAFGVPVPHSLAFQWQRMQTVLFSSTDPSTAVHTHAGLLTLALIRHCISPGTHLHHPTDGRGLAHIAEG